MIRRDGYHQGVDVISNLRFVFPIWMMKISQSRISGNSIPQISFPPMTPFVGSQSI